jgi:AcrR family transcriptional regulator
VTVPTAESQPSRRTRADTARDRVGGTRRAILDVSLELFADQGYGGTSLRHIADRLGITKAAIYHHFKAKEDIARVVVDEAVALFGQIADRLAVAGTDPAGWQRALDQVIDMAIASRQLLLVWDRNEQVFHTLFDDDPDLGPRIAAQGEQTAGLFGNPALSPAERVRLGCAFGAVMGPLMLLSDWYQDLSAAEIRDHIRHAVAALLNPGT